MFAHILAPVDLSERNVRALRVALQVRAPRGARITLLHVIQRIEGIPAAQLRGFYRGLERTARRRLGALAKPLAAKGADVRCEVFVGEPAIDIARVAKRQRADVVVMASHRVEPGRRGRGLGTTSYKAAILCPCPVLLVK